MKKRKDSSPGCLDVSSWILRAVTAALGNMNCDSVFLNMTSLENLSRGHGAIFTAMGAAMKLCVLAVYMMFYEYPL